MYIGNRLSCENGSTQVFLTYYTKVLRKFFWHSTVWVCKNTLEIVLHYIYNIVDITIKRIRIAYIRSIQWCIRILSGVFKNNMVVVTESYYGGDDIAATRYARCHNEAPLLGSALCWSVYVGCWMLLARVSLMIICLLTKRRCIIYTMPEEEVI